MGMDSQELRRVMGHFATGVTVVTTRDKDGNPSGLTVNAFNSLSINPPLVLICIEKAAECYSLFEESGVFAVNLLSEEQEELSRRFATKGIEKFAGVKWRKCQNDVPLLDGAIGYIECKIINQYDGGDHTIYIGEIVNATAADDRPLLFFNGRYRRLNRQEE
mgnify:CR=1 FL=1